jgi:hypothetical protein
MTGGVNIQGGSTFSQVQPSRTRNATFGNKQICREFFILKRKHNPKWCIRHISRLDGASLWAHCFAGEI